MLYCMFSPNNYSFSSFFCLALADFYSGYTGTGDSFFSLIPLRKEPCVYCVQVCTSELSRTLSHPLEQRTQHLTQHAPVSFSPSLPIIRREMRACHGAEVKPFVQTLRDLCVSLFSLDRNISRSNKIYF